MKKILRMFKIRREEIVPSLIALVLFIGMHWLLISKYFKLFSQTGKGHWNIFVNNFMLSGFDPITYSMLTYWEANYNVYRHPFLSFMVWPLSQLNKLIMETTGFNAAQFIVALPLLVCAYYTFIFMFRIFRDIVRIKKTDAVILSFMLLSFAYIMLSIIAPDHFGISLFLLVFALYVSGIKMQQGTVLKTWQTVVLFFITAGITLSNGIKIFIDALFVNGRKFFRIKYLLLGIILPSALIWGFARWEYRTFVWPREMARNAARDKAQAEKKQKLFEAFADTAGIKDSVQLRAAFDREMNRRIQARYKADRKKPWNRNTGRPIAKGEFMNWTDATTSRWATAVENLFGESIQLHQKFLLGDTLRNRPAIVRYNTRFNYAVEAVIFMLFISGIWYGRRSRFLWMCLAGFAFDLFLHLGLGFGINEVYIMGAHWLFVIPVAMAYLVKSSEGKELWALRSLLVFLAGWLWIYNGYMLAWYLTL